ncbi:MAG: LamG domain-containing protein, partial [Nanoarchaeota archaeon]
VSFYSFNLNESGNATDEEQLNNATCTNCPDWNESYGVVGAGYNFTTDYINITSAVNNLASTTTGTWTAWINPNDATIATHQDMISFGDTTSTDVLNLLIELTTGKLRFATVDAGSTRWDIATDVSPFTDGAWTHVAVVQDGVEPILYANGIKVAQTFTVSTDKTEWFGSMGTEIDNGRIANLNFNNLGEHRFFNGTIDEVKIYNRSLSASEILDLYELGTSHILWNAFTDEGSVTSGTAKSSTNNGTFFQYKTNFSSSSGFVFNQSIQAWNSSVSETTVPNVTINSPLNQDYDSSKNITYNVTANDSTAVDLCWFTLDSGTTNTTLGRDGTTNYYNYTNYSLLVGSFTAKFYCNDTLGNVNNTQTVNYNIPIPARSGGVSTFIQGQVIEVIDLFDFEIIKPDKFCYNNYEDIYIYPENNLGNFTRISSMNLSTMTFINYSITPISEDSINKNYRFKINFSENNLKETILNITLIQNDYSLTKPYEIKFKDCGGNFEKNIQLIDNFISKNKEILIIAMALFVISLIYLRIERKIFKQ